ncbi:Similar to At3g55350: Protein ALP1-like (Arabidopsis thaliana) [Cotesia congregata]|uniref:Putative nuclease HARBI1 n=1 Tax=Cotesia congregata TaxID=51543 RepID=A0A8J2H8T7_COTCN|nr:Similar to At3g55350: Protein ALP1-like (Arabidopsis thaliana) [Cotesia congregata]
MKYCDIHLSLSFKKEPIPRLQNFVEEVIPAFTDKEFKSHFRLCRSTFNFILNTIKPSLTRKISGSPMIPPEKQLLIAIWKMATPDSYRYNEKILLKFQFCRSVIKLTLVEIAPHLITWPENEKFEEISNQFEATSGFPKVIGAIDGTHINIPTPRKHPESYVNRKGHHSIQLQAVCDAQSKFIHCCAGNVGSVHDARVFRLSEVHGYLSDPEKFPNDCHLVGDAAYPLHKHLLTPYRDNGHLSARQKNYNFCHSSARIAIERAFGLLKKRPRSLLTVLDMNRTDLIPEYIIACCVLHNICLLKEDEFLIEEIIEENANINDINDNGQNRALLAEGAEKRNRICDQLIIRNV